MTVCENALTPEEFRRLFTSVGWEAPGLDQISGALKNSWKVFSLWEDGIPVGMARLLGDGGMSFYLKDFAILPEWQGKGLGKLLMEHILHSLRKELPPGWAVSLELISAQGKEGFYERMGFDLRPSEDDGAGMFQMVAADRNICSENF